MQGGEAERPIADAVEALTEVRDKDVPGETDGVLDVLRGEMENVRRLVERSQNASLLGELDAAERAMEGDVRSLRNELGTVLTGEIGKLEELRRHDDSSPEGGVSDNAAAVALTPSPLPVIHIRGAGDEHEEIRKNPPPNTIIVVDEGAVYTTDDQGRVVLVEATLTDGPPAPRNEHHQRTLPGKAEKDDAGHLIASVLGGNGDRINLVPMGQQVNRSKFATLENRWRKIVRSGGTVDVEIKVRYREGPRPTMFVIIHGPTGEEPDTEIIRNRSTKRKPK